MKISENRACGTDAQKPSKFFDSWRHAIANEPAAHYIENLLLRKKVWTPHEMRVLNPVHFVNDYVASVYLGSIHRRRVESFNRDCMCSRSKFDRALRRDKVSFSHRSTPARSQVRGDNANFLLPNARALTRYHKHQLMFKIRSLHTKSPPKKESPLCLIICCDVISCYCLARSRGPFRLGNIFD